MKTDLENHSACVTRQNRGGSGACRRLRGYGQRLSVRERNSIRFAFCVERREHGLHKQLQERIDHRLAGNLSHHAVHGG